MKLSQGNPDKFQTDTHNQREEKTVYSQAVSFPFLFSADPLWTQPPQCVFHVCMISWQRRA